LIINRLKNYYSKFGISGLLSVIQVKLRKSDVLIKVEKDNIKFPFYLRSHTSDIPTYDQVFIDEEYRFVSKKTPKIIVDAGANIGMATIYFANKYPEAKIIAIEPEKSNFDLLKRNVEPYKNIILLNAALWGTNEDINLVDPGLGNWGFMTQNDNVKLDNAVQVCHKTIALTVDKLMEKYTLENIDILKIDIEGAELEVFEDTSLWIEKVNSLIVELHDRMKPGCSRSFYNGTNGFDTEWRLGENVYLSRKQYISPST